MNYDNYFFYFNKNQVIIINKQNKIIQKISFLSNILFYILNKKNNLLLICLNNNQIIQINNNNKNKNKNNNNNYNNNSFKNDQNNLKNQRNHNRKIEKLLNLSTTTSTTITTTTKTIELRNEIFSWKVILSFFNRITLFKCFDNLLNIIVYPNAIYIINLDDFTYKGYSSLSSKSIHSVCYLSQKKSHEKFIIEHLHIDISLGVDDFLLFGTDSGDLEYIRLISNDSTFRSIQSITNNVNIDTDNNISINLEISDITSCLSLHPIPSLSPSPITSIFIDYPLIPDNCPLPIPEISSNIRTPLLCIYNMDGILCIYQSYDNQYSHLSKEFRISLIGSCIWKFPQSSNITSTSTLTLTLIHQECNKIIYWNGIILTLHSGSLFGYHIEYKKISNSYSISSPVLITPPNIKYIHLFSILPEDHILPNLSIENSFSQYLYFNYDSTSSVISLSQLFSTFSPPSFTSLTSLTQSEIHSEYLKKFLQHFISFIHTSSTINTKTSSEIMFKKDDNNECIKDLLNNLSESISAENELICLNKEIDNDIIQHTSLIQLLQSNSVQKFDNSNEIKIKDLTCKLSFDTYLQHDTSYFFSSDNNKNIFLGLFTLQTTSELVMKAFQGKQIDLSWKEELLNSMNNTSQSKVSHSWNYTINFQLQNIESNLKKINHIEEKNYIHSIVLPLPIHHLCSHSLSINITVSITPLNQTSRGIYQTDLFNLQRNMKFTESNLHLNSNTPQIYGLKDYFNFQQNTSSNSFLEISPTSGVNHENQIDRGLIILPLETIYCNTCEILQAIQGNENNVIFPQQLHSFLSLLTSSSYTSNKLSHIINSSIEVNSEIVRSLILDEIKQEEIQSSTLVENELNQSLLSYSITIPLPTQFDDHQIEIKSILPLQTQIEEFLQKLESKLNSSENKVLTYSYKILSSVIESKNFQSNRETSSSTNTTIKRLFHRSNNKYLLCFINFELKKMIQKFIQEYETNKKKINNDTFPYSPEVDNYIMKESDIFSLPREIQQTLMSYRVMLNEIKSFQIKFIDNPKNKRDNNNNNNNDENNDREDEMENELNEFEDNEFSVLNEEYKMNEVNRNHKNNNQNNDCNNDYSDNDQLDENNEELETKKILGYIEVMWQLYVTQIEHST